MLTKATINFTFKFLVNVSTLLYFFWWIWPCRIFNTVVVFHSDHSTSNVMYLWGESNKVTGVHWGGQHAEQWSTPTSWYTCEQFKKLGNPIFFSNSEIPIGLFFWAKIVVKYVRYNIADPSNCISNEYFEISESKNLSLII